MTGSDDTMGRQTPTWWESGVSDADEVLLLIAGTGYSGQTWPKAFLQELTDTYRIVMFDHRGTGNTPGTHGRYTTELFADDAASLIAELGIRPHVVGHSMGGRVAQWLTIRHPDSVKSLILVATGSGEVHSEQSRGIPPTTVSALLQSGYEGYVRSLQRRTFFTPEFAATNTSVVGELGESFWQSRPTLEDYLKHVEARQQHNSQSEIHRIVAPSLVLIGSRDIHEGATGSHYAQSLALHQSIPHSRFSVISGASHGVFWEKPSQTARAIHDWVATGSVQDAY